MARSSTESEYRALAHAAAEISWMQSLLKELNIPQKNVPIIWCDNIGANALVANPVYHSRTKHIELDVHFIRDKFLAKELDVKYIPSCDQNADILTKPLSHHQFEFLKGKLGVTSVPSSLREAVKISDQKCLP